MPLRAQGKYGSSDGNCNTCEAGKYGDAPGLPDEDECKSCPAGSAAKADAAAGATSEAEACASCNAGQFSASAGSQTCTACKAGQYSPGGSVPCAACAPGQYTPNTASFSFGFGAASCAPCSDCGADEVRVGCGGADAGMCFLKSNVASGTRRCWRASLISKSCEKLNSDGTCALRSAALRKYGADFGAVPVFAPFYPDVDPAGAGKWTIEADSDTNFPSTITPSAPLPPSGSLVHLRTATGKYLANAGKNA